VIHFDGHGAYDIDEGRGYLCFTRPGSWTVHRVSGEQLSGHLRHRGLKLLLLSACQSAAVHGEGAFGTVAVQLLAAGIPAVLAMPYSVLTETTRRFFSTFYRRLGKGEAPSSAVVQARNRLLRDPDRHTVERPEAWRVLRMQDWFVPTLYRAGREAVFTASGAPIPPRRKALSNIPSPEVGRFAGRRRALWHIERWFVSGVRRVSLTGPVQFGKSALARETARWLLRSGMFSAVVWLDGRSSLNGNAAGTAAGVLGCAAAPEAVARALLETPVLLVLDHLEALPGGRRAEMLHAVSTWAALGGTRLLTVQRGPASGGSPARSREWAVGGLDMASALDFFYGRYPAANKEAGTLPPRAEIREILRVGDGQPAFIDLAATVYPRVAGLPPDKIPLALAEHPASRGWLAPVKAAFDSLDDALRTWLPVLGVFEQGAMEDDLLLATGLARLFGRDRPQEAARRWMRLRTALEAAGLARCEKVHGTGVRYVRFHPALKPILQPRLSDGERQALERRHAAVYGHRAMTLYRMKGQAPEAATARTALEAPNLSIAAMELHRERRPEGWPVVDAVLSLLARIPEKGRRTRTRLLREVS
jgi:hypothetical protein